MNSRRDRRAIGAIVAIAFLLRLVQAGLRYDEIALAYAAYQEPFEALFPSDFAGMLTCFHGLHPPLYSLCFSLLNAIWAAPACWLLFSAACSAGAVWLVGRLGGPAAAAILAVDPLQVAYAGEINNYPLLVLEVSALLLLTDKALRGGSTKGLMVVGILSGWTHVLGGVVFGACLIRLFLRDRVEAVRVGAVVLVCCLPVVWMLLDLSGSASTYGQSGWNWVEVASGLHEKIGWWWLLVFPAGVGAWRHDRALGGVALGLCVTLLALIAIGVAAPHQQPYWLVLGAPVALLVASNRGVLPWLLSGLGLIGLIGPLSDRVNELQHDLARERAVDRAIAEARPSDAFWLVSPALKPDDDKTATSSVLWRFSPWAAAPAWHGPPNSFEYANPQYGQPRVFGGRVVHTSVDIVQGSIQEGCRREFEEARAFREAVGWHLAEGRRVWVVLYDHSPACEMPAGLDWAMEPFDLVDLAPNSAQERCIWVGDDVGLGRDRLCLIGGR